MRREFLVLVGLIGVLMFGSMSAGRAQDAFKDGVGSLNQAIDHWGYAAVEDLFQKGIVKGYPDGYFRGKRAVTRYEFAVTMKRFIDYFKKQNEPRKVAFLKSFNDEMALIWAETDKLAEATEVSLPKKNTSAVAKPNTAKRAP